MKLPIIKLDRLELATRCAFVFAAVSIVAFTAGIGISSFLSITGETTIAFVALPVLICLSLLFFLKSKIFFYSVLACRSACDILFESSRTGIANGGPGIGGLVNAAIICLMISVFSKKEFARKKPAMTIWLIFFATTVYGIILAPSQSESVRFTLTWLSNFAIFYCAAHYVTSLDEFKSILRIIVASSIIPVSYGYYALACGLPSVAPGRVQSTFSHPNIFAFYLVLIICVVFFQLKSPLFRKTVWGNITSYSWIAALLGMLLATQTRSAWLICLLMFTFYGIFFERRFLIYIIALCITSMFIEPVRERMINLVSPEVESSLVPLDAFRWRVELWIAGLEWMEIKNYFLGYGIGAFSTYAPIFFERGDGLHWDAHNVYIQWFFEVGAVGVLVYTWLHVRTLYLLVPLFRADRLLSYISAVTVIGYMIVSFSDNMMFYLTFNWYYWCLLGAIYSVTFVRADNFLRHDTLSCKLKKTIVLR